MVLLRSALARGRQSHEPRARDNWYVTNGVVAVGPIHFDAIRRGVAEGRFLRSSYVRHGSWNVWRHLQDLENLGTDALEQTVAHLASLTASLGNRELRPAEEFKSPSLLNSERPHSEAPLRSSVRPVAVDPVGVLKQAEDLDDALLLTLSTAVTAVSAQLGLFHRFSVDRGIAMTTCGHGPMTELSLGTRIPASDPVLLAALEGQTILAEPEHGRAGRQMAARLTPCLPGVVGLAMVPIRHYQSLVGFIEVGQLWRPFAAREVGRIEDIADVLLERIIVEGWLEEA